MGNMLCDLGNLFGRVQFKFDNLIGRVPEIFIINLLEVWIRQAFFAL